MRKNNDFNKYPITDGELVADRMNIRDGINEAIVDAEAYNGHKHEDTLKTATLEHDEDELRYKRDATGIQLAENKKTIKVGEPYIPVVSATPNGANLPTLTWVSSNDNVARVTADGLIMGIDKGTATITVYGHVSEVDIISAELEITVA